MRRFELFENMKTSLCDIRVNIKFKEIFYYTSKYIMRFFAHKKFLFILYKLINRILLNCNRI